jgi:integrase
MRLTARKLRALTAPGLYGDGGNLYLQVRGPERRSWLFRYMINGRARSMGLGHLNEVSLAEARSKAGDARKLVREGVDPLNDRAAAAARSKVITFSEAADRYITAHESGWRSALHRAAWRSTLAIHVEPVIGKLPVEAIDTALVLKVLTPIWQTKTESASRIRGRIERVLSFATVQRWRTGPNPAQWRGHLQLMLPPRSKVQPVKHYEALDWREAPAFMAKLRAQDTVGARALEFAILTAARPSEARGATWDEVDLEAAFWTIPGERMKAEKAHRVPLSKAALALLESMSPMRSVGGPVFPGRSLRLPLAHPSLIRPLRRMGYGDLTVHGFRSTFRDWAAEATAYPNHVVEQALAHTIGNAVEAAYRRGDLFAKRVALMNDWAAYLAQPAAEIVHLRRGAQKAPRAADARPALSDNSLGLRGA